MATSRRYGLLPSSIGDAPGDPACWTTWNALDPVGTAPPSTPLKGRIVKSPVMFCSASACLLPMTLAFAVKWTSSVDSWMESSISGAGLRRSSDHSTGVKGCSCGAAVDYPSGVHIRKLSVSDRLKRSDSARAKHANRSGVSDCRDGAGDVLNCVGLARSQHPRICSDTDVKRGCGGGMRRLPNGFPSRPWCCVQNQIGPHRKARLILLPPPHFLPGSYKTPRQW